MLFSKVEKKIAWRYMRAKRRGFGSVISWVSLVGIILGVMTLVIVMSVMSGFHNVLLNRIIGMNGHIVIYHQDGAIKDYDFLSKKILENREIAKDVNNIVPIVEGQVMASFEGKNSGAMVRGIKITDFEKKINSGTKIYGTSLNKLKINDVVVGTSLARSLRITLGDKITLIAANGGTPTAFGTMPRVMSYNVRASFFMGMYEYDSGYIFMSLSDAQKYFGMGNAVTHIDLFLHNPEQTETVKKLLAENLPDGFVVRDWKELNRGFIGALQVESNVMFLILMLIVIVAVFNIVSSLVMLVKDKSHDIAIFRTFGMPAKSMMKVFILSGTTIGIVGATLGSALGVLVATYIEPIRQFFQWMTGRDLFPADLYFLSELPSDINPLSVIGIAGIAILLSFLATLYPAWKASKTDPVEVLRYE